TAYRPTTPAPPNMPAPIPARLPLMASSAFASSISWWARRLVCSESCLTSSATPASRGSWAAAISGLPRLRGAPPRRGHQTGRAEQGQPEQPAAAAAPLLLLRAVLDGDRGGERLAAAVDQPPAQGGVVHGLLLALRLPGARLRVAQVRGRPRQVALD